MKLFAIACLAATAAALTTPTSSFRAPSAFRGRRTSKLVAQQLPPGWISGVDQASGATYYYNEQTGVSQWEPPQQGFGGQPQQGYGAQVAWRLYPAAGITGHGRFTGVAGTVEKFSYLPYSLNQAGDDFVLGRFNMVQQSPYVSRQQCVVAINYDGSATVTSIGKPNTGVRSAYGGQWELLGPNQQRMLQNGDQISLDVMNPEGAVFTCQNEGDGQQQQQQQQGGYGQQQGYYQQQY